MEQEINELRNELQDSKEDFNIILNYLRKKDMQKVENRQRKSVINSCKIGLAFNKSNSIRANGVSLCGRDMRNMLLSVPLLRK